MRRRLAVAALAAIGSLTACTPQELADWVAWHEQDPAAALAALPEPEPEPQVAWTLNWDAVSRCESGGQWGHRPVRNSAGTFSGGLMIGHGYWKGYGGYSAPYLAPKSVQIAWAEDLIDGSYRVADNAWQCIGGPARSGV